MHSPNNGGQWGILGGSFNPVHRGHIALAVDLAAAKGYDGVLMVPSFIPPRKVIPDMASFEDRVAMLRLACESFPKLVVSTIEAESDTPGYTLLTVRALKKRYPKTTFSFIIGADLLAEFESWYEAKEILNELTIVVGSRPGSHLEIPPGFNENRFELIETTLLDISSREIRESIRAGIKREELIKIVPDKVADYLIERGLYT
jgi:nicotinate-nucleotide adenylyltransferase